MRSQQSSYQTFNHLYRNLALRSHVCKCLNNNSVEIRYFSITALFESGMKSGIQFIYFYNKKLFLFEQPHSHFFFSYHAQEKVLLYVFPQSFVCWLKRISGLSGPRCWMANLSSNLNPSNGFFNRESTVFIAGATPLAMSTERRQS